MGSPRGGDVWRLLPYSVGPSDAHFARSDALVRQVSIPTVWWHSTDRPTLILGAGQRWSADDVERCEAAGVRVVRRQAGGTAVYAGPGVLGLDIALPRDHRLVGSDVVEGYRWLGEVWVEALGALGVDGHLVTIAEARSTVNRSPLDPVVRTACFGSLSPYEVTIDSRKLVGLAQVRRSRGALLQSGIHLRFDADSLAAVLSSTDPTDLACALREAAVGLNDVLPGASRESAVMETFQEALQTSLGVQLIPGQWSPG